MGETVTLKGLKSEEGLGALAHYIRYVGPHGQVALEDNPKELQRMDPLNPREGRR